MELRSIVVYSHSVENRMLRKRRCRDQRYEVQIELATANRPNVKSGNTEETDAFVARHSPKAFWERVDYLPDTQTSALYKA